MNTVAIDNNIGMGMFERHRLVKVSSGYLLVLYIDPGNTEFGMPGERTGGPNRKLTEYVRKYVAENFSDIKIKAVKIVAGSLLTTTITLTSYAALPLKVQAGECGIVAEYRVKQGDSLWSISRYFGVGIESIKDANNISGDVIYPGQELLISLPAVYTVVEGESLWSISVKTGVSVEKIREYNNISGDIIHPGQQLSLVPVSLYTVQPGDTLWGISRESCMSVEQIKSFNNLTSDTIVPGQQLLIGKTPQEIPQWPEITYIVQAGDNAGSISQKFGIPASDILKYNYMEPNEWFYAGDKIAISGYAPRTYTVTPGQDSAPAAVGAPVDWFTEGQYTLKRNDEFIVTDVASGRQFTLQMIGGYNHCDIEPASQSDTDVMLQLFGSWKWTPRAAVIYKDGINIAASLSGMPHGVDTIYGNGVSGHFDLYLKNSKSHNPDTSETYQQQHRDMVAVASGKTP